MNNYSDFPSLQKDHYKNDSITRDRKSRKSQADEISSEISKYIEVVGKLCSKGSTIDKITELNAKIKELETDISSLTHFDQIAQLNSTKMQIEGVVKALKKFLPTEQEETPSMIFEIESRMREALAKDVKGKAKLQQIYDSKVIPLVNMAKKKIKKNSFHFSSVAASSKGAALQAGIGAVKNLTENQSVITNAQVSAQQVFLIPKENTVFKLSKERAAEEEQIVNDLFDLMSEKAVVGTFNLKSTSRKKFGIQIPIELRQRGYLVDSLDPNLKQALTKKLSSKDLELIKNEEISPRKLKGRDFYIHSVMNEADYLLKPPGENWIKVSFKELQKLYYSDKLIEGTLVGISEEIAIPISAHILNSTVLFDALNYNPEFSQDTEKLLLTPNLSDQVNKNAYELCEKFIWSFQDSNGKVCECNFKQLQANFLMNLILNNIDCIPNKENLQKPTSEDFLRAINVDWKVVSPELMKAELNNITPLSDVQAKPFISNMILMKDLTFEQRESALRRLTPTSEFNAILTGEVQLLDLHSGNLGIAPELKEGAYKFKDLKFSTLVDGKFTPNLNFNQLLLDNMTGKLQKNHSVQYVENGITISNTLENLPELEKALDVRWELIIFDTDLSLTESNFLQYQTRAGRMEHLIPFRSVLLETNWKETPLSRETVDRLLDSTGRDLRVSKWVKNSDAPIYKRLTQRAQKLISPLINFMIKEYNLSDSRFDRKNGTIKSLKGEFVANLSILNSSTSFIWKVIENDLSHVRVHSNDTWESLAKQYRQHVDELKLLNQNGLETGKRIKINYDLTSDTVEALKKRREIAAQFFPRITDRQQAAMAERQQRRTEYLTNYMELFESELKGEQLFEQIEKFVNLSVVPVTSLRKEELLKEINTNKQAYLKNPRKVLNFYKDLCSECQPTYFNLMKVMYPLLADAYALNQAVYGDSSQAGMIIGLYSISLQDIINFAKGKFDINSKEGKLVLNLEKQMASVNKPAFFGHW